MHNHRVMEAIRCKHYNIYFEDWKSLNTYIDRKYSNVVVISDENTHQHCVPVFEKNVQIECRHIIIPAGEQYKNLTTAKFIWQEMMTAGCDRHSLCINLGGGVIGDMGGWTAASYMRGMDFIQIPTTLLSMVDASVGGKLAIDFNGVKNIIGLIKDPKAVFIFPEFLETLSPRLIKSGMAEVLKHGLIQKRSYWEKVKTFSQDADIPWTEWIYESVIIKKNVTEEDPYEKGVRKILNYGHTLGHAIESHSMDHDDDPFTHGEAIAIGMICEAWLSYVKGMISKQDLEEITQGVLAVFGKETNSLPSYDSIKKLLIKDKKNVAGTVMYSLLSAIGEATFNKTVNDDLVQESIQYYEDLLLRSQGHI